MGGRAGLDGGAGIEVAGGMLLVLGVMIPGLDSLLVRMNACSSHRQRYSCILKQFDRARLKPFCLQSTNYITSRTGHESKRRRQIVYGISYR
jgi:hypothetical protein